MPALGQQTVLDDRGDLLDPGSCSHVYGYDGSGNLITDTATNGSQTWVQTLTYAAGALTGTSKWVRTS